MLMPPVSRYMTLDPVLVQPDDSMTRAHELMRARRAHHLPVVVGARLVGVVSDRDLHLLETLRDVDPDVVTVGEAMTANVYAVAPSTPLDQVLTEMIDRRLGSAIVVGERGVEGIFTSVDGLRALVEMLDRETA
jgi:acetoin utilization protein AcuB